MARSTSPPSPKRSGHDRLRKLSCPSSGESSEANAAHAESSERRGRTGHGGLDFEEPAPLDFDRTGFYVRVAGLCDCGPHPNDVSEEMMPRSKWAAKWGEEAMEDSTATTIWLEDADSDDTRKRYESLYVKVYGNKPAGGGLPDFFVRAAAYYLGDLGTVNWVNWAALAVEIHQDRISDPELDPVKRVPARLSKRVRRMMDELVVTPSDLGRHPPPAKRTRNLGPSYLDEFKRQLRSARAAEAACLDQISTLKQNLATNENGLVEAKKSLQNHNEDLQLLFEPRPDATVNGDTDNVDSTLDRIKAVAQTIADGVETIKFLEHRIEDGKENVRIARVETLPALRSIVSDKECFFLDAISKVGLFPQQVLRTVPERDVTESLCPYCRGAYVQNAYVPLSCGCCYHPPCMRVLMLSGEVNCLACGARPHGTWMAYWGFPLDKEMSEELEDMRKELGK